MIITTGFPLKPVFDCDDDDVRRTYPAQCPTASDPLITGGGQGHHNGNDDRGLIGRILHSLGLL